MTFLGDFRQAVQDALDAEFAGDDVMFVAGKLSPTAGREFATGAVFADGWAEIGGRVAEANVQVRVQMWDRWGDYVDPEASYDVTLIEAWADRITSVVQAHQHDAGWFMRITQLLVGDDPHGQPSRLEAIIVGRTQNPFETTGGAG